MSQNLFAGSSLMISVLQSMNNYMSQTVSLLSQINNSILQSTTSIVQAIGALGTYIGPKMGGAIPYANQFQISMGKLLNALGATPGSMGISALPVSVASTAPLKTFTSDMDKLKTVFGGGKGLFQGIGQGLLAGVTHGVQRFSGGSNLKLATGTGAYAGAGGMLGGIGGLGRGIASSMSPMVNQFKAMGPQMLAMSIILAPIQAFLEGILTPLEPLSELAGAFGEILGTALVPLVNMLMTFLTPFIPILTGIANLIAPLLPILFMILTPFGQVVALFKIMEAFMPPDVGAWFANLPTVIGDALSGAGSWITDQLKGLWGIVVDFFGGLGFQLGVALTKVVNDLMHTSYGGSDANLFTSV
jgi:hypothetical protein